MKKYRVTIPIFASVTVEIEAENEEEAKENASISSSLPSLCYRCSSEGIELGEYDDTGDIEAEEIE